MNENFLIEDNDGDDDNDDEDMGGTDDRWWRSEWNETKCESLKMDKLMINVKKSHKKPI